MVMEIVDEANDRTEAIASARSGGGAHAAEHDDLNAQDPRMDAVVALEYACDGSLFALALNDQRKARLRVHSESVGDEFQVTAYATRPCASSTRG